MRERVRPARLLAVVKADAYGHGAPRVASGFWKRRGSTGWGWRCSKKGPSCGEPASPCRSSCSAPPGRASSALRPLSADADGVEPRPARALARLHGGRRRTRARSRSTSRSTPGWVGSAWRATRSPRRSRRYARPPVCGWTACSPTSPRPTTWRAPSNRRQEERFAEVLALLTAEERRRVAVHLANSAARPASAGEPPRPGALRPVALRPRPGRRPRTGGRGRGRSASR